MQRLLAPANWRWIASDSVLLVVGLVAIGTVADFGLRVLLAHTVEPAEFGDFAIAYGVLVLGGVVAVLGADRTTMRFLPGYIEAADHARVAGFVAMFAAAAVVVAIVLALLVVATHMAMDEEHEFFFHTAKGHPLLIAIWIIPFYALSRLTGGVMNSAKRPVLDAVARYYVLPGAVTVIILALLLAGADISPAEILIAYGMAFALAVVFGFTVLPGHVRCWHPERSFLPKLWLALSLPIMGREVVNKLAGYTGPFMLEWLGPEEAEVGFFSAAYSAGSLILIPSIAMAAIVLPRFGVIATGERNHDARQALFGRATGQLVLLAALFTAPLILFSAEALSLFGAEYVAAEGALIFIAIALSLSVTFCLAASFLQFTGHGKLVLAVFAASVLLDVALCAVLIPRYGLQGAAVSFLIRTVIAESVLLLLLWRLEGLVPFVNRTPRARARAVGARV